MRIKAIIAAVSFALLGVGCAFAQTGSAKSTTVLNSEVNSLWPDQNSGAITPFNARQTLLDIIASYPNTPSGQSGQTGYAVMRPFVNQSTTSTVAWNAQDPFGNAINCAGTHSQCLQEFITATASSGWPARIYCQGTIFPGGTEPVFINTSVGISVPVAQDWDFRADSTCNLNINVTTTSGLTLDSQGASVFIWDGKIVYNVTSPTGNTTVNPSCVVYLNPQTNTQDGFAGIYAGLVRIKGPVAIPVSGTITGVICANTSVGSVIQQTLEFQEVNANNAAFNGIMIFGAGATSGFMQNHVYANQIHGATSKAIDLGHAATNQANYNSNIWVLPNIENNGALSRGVDTWASNDIFDIGVINNAQGGLQYGIVNEAAANNNQFRYGNISGATTSAVLDGGTCTEFRGAQGDQFVIRGTTSGCIKTLPQAAGGSYNWNLPTTAGSAGQVLNSQGGGASAMTWTSMRQIIPLSSAGAVAQNSTVFEVSAANATEGVAQGVCPIAGTFKNLYIATGAIGGSSQTVTATLRTAGSDSSLTCQINTGSTTCNDATHTATCTAGQNYSVKVVTSATTGSVSFVSGGVEFDNP